MLRMAKVLDMGGCQIEGVVSSTMALAVLATAMVRQIAARRKGVIIRNGSRSILSCESLI